jgi:acyl carrier protein
MEAQEIRTKIKEIIADVANLDPEGIADEATYVDDLGLDSLSLLEIGVDIDYHFKLGVSDERLKELRSIQDAVELVLQIEAGKAAAGKAG